MPKKEIKVVGAAIQRDGKIFTVQRGLEKTLPGLWEFPGGKIENGETPEAALVREIKEELATEIEIIGFVNTAAYDYDFGRVSLSVFTARIITGDLALSEHIDQKWLAADELRQVPWAPVDYAAIELLERM